MIFSNRFQYLFVHIAKTGGTSIKDHLKRHRWRDPLAWPQLLCANLSAVFGHRLGVKFPRHARAVAAKEMLPRALFESLFKFCFVRNPWDLQVSAFHHIQNEQSGLVRAQGLETFEAYLRWSLDPRRPYNYFVNPLNQPMLDSITDLNGDVLVDFVGRFECLAEDWQGISERIGLPVRDLPRRRASKQRKPYAKYYDAQLRELVREHYARDIEAFGYTFEGGLPDGPLIGGSLE